MEKAQIKVIITDDHPMIISGLRNMLSGYEHIQVIGAFNNGFELMDGLQSVVPDVLLLDIQLPGKTGDELVPEILKKYPEIHILALTNYDSVFYLNNMLRLGVSGYLLKTTHQDTLLTAIEAVNIGKQFIEPSLKEKWVRESGNYDKQIYAQLSLTIREKEITRLLTKGLDNKAISKKLFIGYHTVRNYRARIFAKLEVNTISELVNKALLLGLGDSTDTIS